MTIDGAVLTSEMIEQIREWQQNCDLETDLITLDRSIDLFWNEGILTISSVPRAQSISN